MGPWADSIPSQTIPINQSDHLGTCDEHVYRSNELHVLLADRTRVEHSALWPRCTATGRPLRRHVAREASRDSARTEIGCG